MRSAKKGLVSLLLAMTLLIGSVGCLFATSNTGDIQGQTAGEAFVALNGYIAKGEVPAYTEGNPYYGVALDTQGFGQHTYKTSGGGYLIYSELVTADSNIIDEAKFKTLTASSKQAFLQDLLTICNAAVWETENNGSCGTSRITNDTVTDVMDVLQQKSGMGSQLLATLLANTKPDYVTANRIYAPFSGVIGTIMGLLAILTMALLGVTMALDIAYIVIPAFQLLLDGDTDGAGQGGGSATKGMSKIISQAARTAVSAANDGGGAGGQTGSGNKMALGVYFKYRWKELIVLGICLLYLVQGQIYSFVAWILDLVSGFLGF